CAIQVILLHVRQREEDPTSLVIAPAASIALGERAIGVMVAVASQRQLFQVVLALHAVRGFANLLNGWQQQADQNGNDGDDHQQFDQGEASAGPPSNLQREPRHSTNPPWAITKVDNKNTPCSESAARSLTHTDRMRVI